MFHEKGKMTDSAIDMCIKNIAANDIESLKELYDELRIPIYKFALSIVRCPEVAEDIAQESFLRIMTNAKTYRSIGKPKAWIFSIVRNLALSELRDKVQSINIDQLSGAEIPYVEPISVDESHLILDILRADEREIVYLHVIVGLKHYDIAKIMEQPYTQIRWKYAYAIKKLRKHLALTEYNNINEVAK